ncbi:hypothetical protein [Sporomusa malonica]|nr:hypothetical protein [Sporomusa malonica]
MTNQAANLIVFVVGGRYRFERQVWVRVKGVPWPATLPGYEMPP